MPNRLSHETSPYLKQHADNPVDWYPWGDEALQRARQENKPILLSIGYAACHWCHVMAHESFEDPATAKLMNELFINIKVDREERPDIDGIYMQAVQAMTGHGGWPMTVALTPDGVPFFGGTYFPPNERHGLPSFRRILLALAKAFHERPEQVADTVARMRQFYAAQHDAWRGSGTLLPRTLEAAYRGLDSSYDERFAGFGGAPKFPPTMALEFLMSYAVRTGTARAQDIAAATFRAMSRGGMYDQIGGGFHRYSVDERWLVPHFEKMLYDNALLVRFGTHLWQTTHDPEVRRVVADTLDWLSREMTSPDGGFYSSLDADSEGREGAYYVWTLAQLRDALGDDADLAAAYWGVTEHGNFEEHGESVLHRAEAERVVAAQLRLTSDEMTARLAAMRDKLAAARNRRERPARDDKILAAWNGLMLRGLAEAARVFESAVYRTAALKNAEFLRAAFVRDGRVTRSFNQDVTKGPGFLEDYAAIALAWLEIYTLTGERRWLDEARSLGDAARRWFWDGQAGAWFDTASDHEQLVTRPRDVTDNAVPSGTSLATELMLRLGVLTGDDSYRAIGEQVLMTLGEAMAQHPSAFGHLLGTADIALNGALEVAIIGPADSESVAEMLRHVANRYLPSLILARSEGEPESDIPLLAARQSTGAALAFVCRHYVCEAPARTVDELSAALDAALRPVHSGVPQS
ncbi:MAG: thioredoxin domain-containing protein [Gemmatimonadota bacterium]